MQPITILFSISVQLQPLFFYFLPLFLIASPAASIDEKTDDLHAEHGPSSSKSLYSTLLQTKRNEQLAAIKSMLKMEDPKKKAKLLKELTDRMKESFAESRDVLSKEDLDFQDFPSDESVRENVAKLIENSAFFGDIALHFPDFTHKYIKKNPDFLELFKWAHSISVNYGVYDESTKKMMALAAQELNLAPRDEDYVNPYSFRSKKEEMQRKAMEEFEKEKENRRKLDKEKNKKGQNMKRIDL